MTADQDRFLDFLLAEHFGEVVLYDLEFTAWPGSRQSNWSAPGEHREIVQIGAVRIAPARNCAEIACFERLVRPRINPVLSPYFIELTGLAQARIDREGVAFEAAMADFRAFVGDTSTLVGAFGADAEVIEENCGLTRSVTPFLPAQMVDIRPTIIRALGLERQSVSSGDLPQRLGYPPAGHAHDALADARAVAIALRHIQSKRRPKGAAEIGADDSYLWG